MESQKHAILVATLVLCSAADLSADEYGTRINLPEDAVVSADFIDSDADSVDDRYQTGPGKPDTQRRPLGLPQVECLGGEAPSGVPDLRLAVEIRSEYENLIRGQNSPLKPSRDTPTSLVSSVASGTLPSKKFVFPDGLVVMTHKMEPDSCLVLVQNSEATRVFLRGTK